MAKSMYDIIKKQNGEQFAKAIRGYDNGIFDVPNLDKIVKYAGRASEPIMAYLVSLKNIRIQEQTVHQDPIDLLRDAGYDAYVADTLEKQNAIQKYFAPGEGLCTFRDKHRFQDYYIINAVRHDADTVQRSKNPQRQDPYGTSVISIQVLKKGGFISIKNRYNHKVENCDNTFNSNPDNIIPGLSDAIKHYFNVDFSAQQVPLPRGYVVINNQIVQYIREIDNTYIGENFYAQNGVIHDLNPDYQIMLGRGIILDMKQGIVKSVTGQYIRFCDSLSNIIHGKKLSVTVAPNKTKTIFVNGKRFIDVQNSELTYINAPTCKWVDLSLLNNLSGDLDFSGTEYLDLSTADLTHVHSIKFNPNAKLIDVSHTNGLSGDLDFSNVQKLYIDGADFNGVKSIKFNRNAQSISASHVRGLTGDLDFSGVEKLKMVNPDAQRIKSIKFNPNADTINLYGIQILSGDLDFSGVKTLQLAYAYMDMAQVKSIKFNPNADAIDLYGIQILSGDLDFSGVKTLKLGHLDLSRVNSIKFNSKAQRLDLTATTGLSGHLDFSGVQELHLLSADLTNVQSIKFNTNPDSVRFLGRTQISDTTVIKGGKCIKPDDLIIVAIPKSRKNKSGFNAAKTKIANKIKRLLPNKTRTKNGENTR